MTIPSESATDLGLGLGGALIEPDCSDDELLAAIQSARETVAPGNAAVWWLGQSGFLFCWPGLTALIDPYLSESLTKKYAVTSRPHIRMTRRPLAPSALTMVDVVLCTHKHSDHMDPETLVELARASPKALFVVPRSLGKHAESLGLPRLRLILLNAGDVRRIGAKSGSPGLLVRAIPSAHESLDTDEQGDMLYLGYVLEAEGLRIYHGGDTLVYPELPHWLGNLPYDAWLTAVNGRDPARGVPGNMTCDEALALASSVPRPPRFLVPHHFEMFTFNTVPRERIAAALSAPTPGMTVHLPRCGARWDLVAVAESESVGEEDNEKVCVVEKPS